MLILDLSGRLLNDRQMNEICLCLDQRQILKDLKSNVNDSTINSFHSHYRDNILCGS